MMPKATEDTCWVTMRGGSVVFPLAEWSLWPDNIVELAILSVVLKIILRQMTTHKVQMTEIRYDLGTISMA